MGTSQADVKIGPYPGPQSLFCSCPIEDIFYGGQRGPGKTFGLLLDFFIHATKHGRNASGLLLRRTMPELDDVIRDSHKVFGTAGWTFFKQKKEWLSPQGATLRMRFLDVDSDADKYQGHSYTWIGVDEIGNFPRPEPIDKLWGTLRSTAGVPCMFRSTGNPGGPGHGWVKKRYIEPASPTIPFERVVRTPDGKEVRINSVFIPGRLEDNPSLIGTSYEANLAVATAGNDALWRAWRYGNWDILAGQYFDIFTPGIHTRPNSDLHLEPWYDRWISLDWGYDDPTAVHWHCMDENRVVYTYREIYERKKISTEIANLICSASEGEKIGQVYVPGDITGKRGAIHTIADEMSAVFRENGLPYPVPADMAPNSRIGGWSLMYQLMKTGHWIIGEDCRKLVEHLPLMVRDTNNIEDVADSQYDHAPDSARYGLKSHLGSVRIPQDELLMEKIKNLQSPQAKYFAHMRLADEQRKKRKLLYRKSRYRIPQESWN